MAITVIITKLTNNTYIAVLPCKSGFIWYSGILYLFQFIWFQANFLRVKFPPLEFKNILVEKVIYTGYWKPCYVNHIVRSRFVCMSSMLYSLPLIKAELSDCGIYKTPLWFGIHIKLYVHYAYHPTVFGGTEFCFMSVPVSEVNSFFQVS